MTKFNGSIFTVPGYSALLAARALGSVILWVDFILIFASLSYYWHASATMIGIASALYGLPGLVLGPILGRIADRNNPITILYFSYLARGATSLLLVFAPSVEAFVLFVLLKGLGNLGAMPAEQVLVRSILTKDQIVSNAGLMTMIDQLTKICAPLVGAIMSQWFRHDAGFVLSAAICLISFIPLVYLNSKYRDINKNSISRPRGVFSTLNQLLRQDNTFRYAFFAAVMQSAVLGLYDPLLALLLKEQGFPAATFGMIVSCTAAGAILGAFVFRRAFLGKGGVQLIALSLIGFGSTVIVPGILTLNGIAFPTYVMLTLWIGNGAFYALAAMSFGVVMQTSAPVEIIGTVSTTARSVQLLALILGPLVGSAVASVSSIGFVFTLSGAIAMVSGGTMFYKKRGRSSDHPQPLSVYD